MLVALLRPSTGPRPSRALPRGWAGGLYDGGVAPDGRTETALGLPFLLRGHR